MFGEQRAGERLGVAPGDRERQQIFDELMIEQRLRTLLDQPLEQARAMAAGVGGGIGPAGCVMRIKFGVTLSLPPSSPPCTQGGVGGGCLVVLHYIGRPTPAPPFQGREQASMKQTDIRAGCRKRAVDRRAMRRNKSPRPPVRR